MKTQADVGIGLVSYGDCSVFKKGEGGPEAPGALRLRNKKATASVASSYSQNPPVCTCFICTWIFLVILFLCDFITFIRKRYQPGKG